MAGVGDLAAEEFDLLSESLAANYYPIVARIREQRPVHRSDLYGGFAMLTRYEDVTEAARDWQTFSSTCGASPVPIDSNFSFGMVETDPPRHRVMRNLLNPLFTKAAAKAAEPRVREIADEMIDAFVGQGTCDFVADFASTFPGRVVYEEVIGAPGEDLPRVLGWLHSVVSEPDRAGMAVNELAEWVSDLFAQRLSTEDPRVDDVIGVLAFGETDGEQLTSDERIGTLSQLILGAVDTTTNALVTSVLQIARNPGLAAQLRKSEQALDVAVDEFLRLEASVPALARIVMHDTEVAGVKIAAGERVLLNFGAANHDPRRYAEPGEVDVTRMRSNDHLSFGFGVHRCIGRHIARLEVKVAVEQVLRRLPGLHLVQGAHLRQRAGTARGLLALPLDFDSC